MNERSRKVFEQYISRNAVIPILCKLMVEKCIRYSCENSNSFKRFEFFFYFFFLGRILLHKNSTKKHTHNCTLFTPCQSQTLSLN